MGGFRFLDHTADVGIVATGYDLKEAFAQAAQGMCDWIADLEGIRETESRLVEVTAHDSTSLLVAFLNEVNYLFETQKFLFKRFQILELSEEHIKAVGFGEPVDLRRHQIKSLVKAATYHQLEIKHLDSHYQVQVILDI